MGKGRINRAKYTIKSLESYGAKTEIYYFPGIDHNGSVVINSGPYICNLIPKFYKEFPKIS